MFIVVGLAVVVLGVALALSFQKERDHLTVHEEPEGALDKNGLLIPKKPMPAGPVVRAYFGIADGSALGPGKLVRLYDLATGRIKVTLATAEGAEFDVEVLKKEPTISGVGNTTQVSIFLSNGGNGALATNESQGQVIMALTNALATREQAGAKLDGLMTMTERRSHQPAPSDAGVHNASDGGRL